MFERIYVAIWGVYFVGLTLALITGILTAGTGVAFGFVLFALIFMGMIAVLPHWATHDNHLKH